MQISLLIKGLLIKTFTLKTLGLENLIRRHNWSVAYPRLPGLVPDPFPGMSYSYTLKFKEDHAKELKVCPSQGHLQL